MFVSDTVRIKQSIFREDGTRAGRNIYDITRKVERGAWF